MKQEMKQWLNVILLTFVLLTPASALARGNILLDAETDALLKTYAAPLLKASLLPKNSVSIYLESSSQVNALASPGLIILFSGLVLKTQNPEELQAIMAHEIAHIAAGHIPTLVAQRSKATLLTVASQIVGLGAIISGLAPLGALILAGGTSVGTYSALGETRVAEASADQAALSYLDKAGISGRGLISFFGREFVPREQAYASAFRIAPNPYTRTHPLSVNRMSYLDQRVKQSASYNKKAPKSLQFAHEMVQAKLYGFIKSPQATLEKYSDNSMQSRYARAIMYAYHLSNRNKSVALIDSLIAQQPKNPYFYELKGYVLSRTSLFNDSVVRLYQKALALAPNNLVMRLEIGNVLINTGKKKLVLQGITHLKLAANDFELARSTFRPMARGYGILGQIGLAELATAEALLSENKAPLAIRHAERALKKIPLNDKISRLRAEDIIAILGGPNRSAQKKRKKVK